MWQPDASPSPDLHPIHRLYVMSNVDCASSVPHSYQAVADYAALFRQCNAAPLAVDCNGKRPSGMSVLLEGTAQCATRKVGHHA